MGNLEVNFRALLDRAAEVIKAHEYKDQSSQCFCSSCDLARQIIDAGIVTLKDIKLNGYLFPSQWDKIAALPVPIMCQIPSSTGLVVGNHNLVKVSQVVKNMHFSCDNDLPYACYNIVNDPGYWVPWFNDFDYQPSGDDAFMFLLDSGVFIRRSGFVSRIDWKHVVAYMILPDMPVEVNTPPTKEEYTPQPLPVTPQPLPVTPVKPAGDYTSPEWIKIEAILLFEGLDMIKVEVEVDGEEVIASVPKCHIQSMANVFPGIATLNTEPRVVFQILKSNAKIYGLI